jgi:hypothetical protein
VDQVQDLHGCAALLDFPFPDHLAVLIVRFPIALWRVVRRLRSGGDTGMLLAQFVQFVPDVQLGHGSLGAALDVF